MAAAIDRAERELKPAIVPNFLFMRPHPEQLNNIAFHGEVKPIELRHPNLPNTFLSPGAYASEAMGDEDSTQGASTTSEPGTGRDWGVFHRRDENLGHIRASSSAVFRPLTKGIPSVQMVDKFLGRVEWPDGFSCLDFIAGPANRSWKWTAV